MKIRDQYIQIRFKLIKNGCKKKKSKSSILTWAKCKLNSTFKTHTLQVE